MAAAAEGQLGVYFVGNDENVGAVKYGCYLFKVAPLHDGTRRVAGVGKYQRFGFVRYQRAQFRRGDFEIVFRLGFKNDGHTAAKSRQRLVADITRLWNNNLIARLNDGVQCGSNGFTAADGNENLGFRVVGDVVLSLGIHGDFPAESGHAPIGRVSRCAPLERADASRADLPRRRKIRLADAEGNDSFHGVGKVKETADAGRADVPHRFRQNVFVSNHKEMFSLPSSSAAVREMSNSLYRRMTNCVEVEVTESMTANSLETNMAIS